MKALPLVVLVALALWFGGGSVPSAARADTFGGACGSGISGALCVADDANMDYCTAYPWDVVYGNQFGLAMVNLDAQTDMYDTYRPSCLSNTDIGGYLDRSPEHILPGGTLGAALCTRSLLGWGNGVCDQGSLIINTSLLTTPSTIRKTLCHEIGHFAGLHHGPAYGGCMISGLSTQSTYSAHHVAHINAQY